MADAAIEAVRLIRRSVPGPRALALADFALFRLRPTRIRWVGGFAQAATVTAERLRDVARGPGATR